jgi:micrococcal nuclease
MTQGTRRFDFATVYNVVDGDTCDIEIDLGFSVKTRHRFRLSRINTPERGEQGWKEATDKLKELILGKQVTIYSDKLDKYGRYLAEIELEGKSINETLLFLHLAKPYI